MGTMFRSHVTRGWVRPGALAGVLLALCLQGLGAADTGMVAMAIDQAMTETASDILEQTDTSRGVCVVLENSDGLVTLSLSRSSGFLVHALSPDSAFVAGARAEAAQQGIGLDRVVFERVPWGPLPHATGTVDLVILAAPSAGMLQSVSASEVLRVLRPLGRALVLADADASGAGPSDVKEWARGLDFKVTGPRKSHAEFVLQITKSPEPGVDDWSHWEHGPDNNPVSEDAVIKAPYMTQWLGRPYYIAMPAITTAAGGRTFVAMGHIAHHEREEPWLNTLLARNGYNGAELWRRQLPNGYLVHRSAFVATDDRFYMINPGGGGCLILDPETGREIDSIRVPEVAGEWKWMAIKDGVLFALAGAERDPAETTLVRSQNRAWSWGELSGGYYAPRVPWGFGDTILAYDLAKQSVLWTHAEPTPQGAARAQAPVDSRAMAVGGDRVYFYCPDARLGCLDAKSGEVVWSNEDANLRALIEQPGKGLVSTPGFRTTCFCVYTPKGLFYEAQTRMNIVAVSKDDGQLMWHRSKTSNNPNVIYLDGTVLVGIGPEGSTLALNPETGETIEDLGFMKRSCVRLTATSDSIFCRGWPEGLTRYDRNTKTISFDGSMRPACNDGVIGANGLLYIGPWLCDCNLTLMGTVALCSAGEATAPTAAADRLERFTDGLAGIAAPGASDIADWDAYRGGTAHTGSSTAAVTHPNAGEEKTRGPAYPSLYRMWSWQPPHAFLPTAPTASDGRVFVAGDDGVVRGLDATTGALAWSAHTAGPVMQPPTLWEGRAYAGSGDGCVYAWEAASGRPLWRFRAAPVERRIMVYGNLCSTWPVNSGVVVADGVACFAAGLIDYDGTYVYAVDAATGALKWENASTGHLDTALRKGISAQGNLTITDGTLWMAGGNVVSPAPYDLATGAYKGPMPDDGSPRANRGEEIGVFGSGHLVSGGRLRYSAVDNVVNPGRFAFAGEGHSPIDFAGGRIAPVWDDDCLVAVPDRGVPPHAYDAKSIRDALDDPKGKPIMPAPLWQADALADSEVMALALARDGVLVACSSTRPRDRRLRWRVCLLDRATGRLQWQTDMPSPVLPNGIAIDRTGRVIVAMKDGTVTCFGSQATFERQVAELAARGKQPETRDQAVTGLRHMLSAVHNPEGTILVMDALRKLGDDPCAQVKRAGFVCDWHLLGPVLWNQQNPIDKRLVGEPDVDMAKAVTVQGVEHGWRRSITAHSTGMMDLTRIYGPHAGHAVYAYAEVSLPQPAELALEIGSNDGFKCWFNGEEAGRFDGGREYAPAQDTLKVRGQAGRNTILLKVTQMGGGWAFGARLVTPQGEPVDLTDSK
jgi:outer membrane protein assembly factor BamB